MSKPLVLICHPDGLEAALELYGIPYAAGLSTSPVLVSHRSPREEDPDRVWTREYLCTYVPREED